jgi:hypothetical protein
MRSVVVVLPASMCAMIPMLRSVETRGTGGGGDDADADEDEKDRDKDDGGLMKDDAAVVVVLKKRNRWRA